MAQAQFKVRTFDTPQAFLDYAGPWLLENEPANNLTLGIAHSLIKGDSRYHPPILLAAIEQDGSVVGTCFRTPPHKLVITQVPAAAAVALVDVVAGLYASIPAVLGPREPAEAVIEAWCERNGGRYRLSSEQGIYACQEVIFPSEPPSGQLRMAQRTERKMLIEWMEQFVLDTGSVLTDPEALVDIRLAEERIFLWDDGGAKSFVAAAGSTPNGIRIGPVYTPAEYRGRGYASVATAQTTRNMFAAGWQSCFLYTDLSNPTSNAIYKKIGYKTVGDVVNLAITSS